MVLNIDNTKLMAFDLSKKALSSDPAYLMLALIEQDKRLNFVYCITQSKFLYTNIAFRHFFGEAIHASPETFLSYVHPDCVAYLKQCFAELQSGVAKHNIEISLNVPNKQTCHLRLSLIYNTNAAGEMALTGYAEEIPFRKVSYPVSEEYQFKKKTLLNILSHDLLSPMGSIHNLAALLSRKNVLEKDPEVGKWVSMIENISKKSIHMIRTFVKKEFAEPSGTLHIKE